MRVRLLTLLIFLLGLSLTHATTASPFLGDGPTNLAADVAVEASQVTWQPRGTFDEIMLTVTGPEGMQLQRAFKPGDDIALAYNEDLLPDGDYTYELKMVAQATEAQIAEAGLTEQLEEARLENEESRALHRLVQEGTFSIEAGQMLRAATGMEAALFDHVIADDCIIQGSMCVGFDCVNNMNFGFDTLVLQENNTRMLFNDTSTSASFPRNDWRLIANDSSNGGAEYFAIEDATAGRRVFEVRAGARSNSLFVDSAGRIGIGTASPSVRVHLKDGNTPTVRLDQDGTSGFTPQVWDLAGNEANFFIRDATNGSALPFRIEPGTASNTLYLDNAERVGINTTNPLFPLDVMGTINTNERYDLGAFTMARFDNFDLRIGGSFGSQWTSVTLWTAGLQRVVVDDIGRVGLNNGGPGFPLVVGTGPTNGNGAFVTTGGVWTDASSRTFKENFEEVDTQAILATVGELPVLRWQYKGASDEGVHMGPVAEDFHAAFGLGVDEKYLASLDVNGVALASIKALLDRVEALEAQNAELAAQQATVTARVDELEQLVKQLATQR